jgi:hypothetical protein
MRWMKMRKTRRMRTRKPDTNENEGTIERGGIGSASA